MIHYILHILGIDNVSGSWYAFWSGFASDLTELSVVAIVYKRLKCKSCWRLAHHKVEGTHYKSCHKHLTSAEHDKIRANHKLKFPEQHRLLKNIK